MIVDIDENIEAYLPLVPELKAVSSLLQNLVVSESEEWVHDSASPRIRFLMLKNSGMLAKRQFHVRRRTIELYWPIAGTCLISTTWPEHARGVPYDTEDDIAFCEGDDTSVLQLDMHHFALFLPGEPHREGAMTEKAPFQLVVAMIEM